LYQYEAGLVRAPDAAVLWGLARIYEVDFEALVCHLIDNRQNTKIKTADSEAVPASDIALSAQEQQIVKALRAMPKDIREECIGFIEWRRNLQSAHWKRTKPRRR
jgi:hypothetical protein